MKSVCIKTNNKNLLKYLLNELEYVEISPVYIAQATFKNYENIIIHYTGNNNSDFIHDLSCILSCLIIDELEEDFLKKIIQKNYFYFEKLERQKILEICFEIFSDDYNKYFNDKYNCLIDDFSSYLNDHKSIVLTGFINFRIQNYVKILENVVDEAVNTFVIEKEYFEFVSLLKLYVNSQNSNCDLLHLVYSNENAFLLDKDKNKIDTNNNIFKAKYLSDISFSPNDFVLNSLLSLLPKKIYIHLLDNCIDEFIHTLCLIFENKIEICTDCNICNLYKKNKKLKLTNLKQ